MRSELDGRNYRTYAQARLFEQAPYRYGSTSLLVAVFALAACSKALEEPVVAPAPLFGIDKQSWGVDGNNTSQVVSESQPDAEDPEGEIAPCKCGD